MSLFPSRAARTGGFTLIELVVALAVVSLGAGVIIKLYTQSLALADSNRNERVAASLGEARLLDAELNAGNYVWPDSAKLAAGDLVQIGLKKEIDEPTPRGYVVAAPATTLTYRQGAQEAANYYEGFTWNAYARLPKPEAGYLELTVVVQWREAGRPRSMALTSCLPRSVVEEAA